MNLLGVHTHAIWQTVVLLALSNVFMTWVGYSHRKYLNEKPRWIALFEYPSIDQLHRLLRNRPEPAKDSAGSHHTRCLHTLCHFFRDQPLKLDYLWAALCILGTVYFVFRT